MGRYLLCGSEASIPYEVEELDIRLYTIEEMCYYIYNNPDLIEDGFIDERLVYFIRHELKNAELADKIERLYASPADLDATLIMLLSDVGYYTDAELTNLQNRLAERRRKSLPERQRQKGDILVSKKRYRSAIRVYRPLYLGQKDARLGVRFYTEVEESLANCYGKLCQFDRALQLLEDIYDQTLQDRVLKKIYDTCVLSGRDLPEPYFADLPPAKLEEWQQDYWNRETVCRQNSENDPEMQMFLKEPGEIKDETADLIRRKKEEYRGMLE